jgi:hypothetical protein
MLADRLSDWHLSAKQQAMTTQPAGIFRARTDAVRNVDQETGPFSAKDDRTKTASLQPGFVHDKGRYQSLLQSLTPNFFPRLKGKPVLVWLPSRQGVI